MTATSNKKYRRSQCHYQKPHNQHAYRSGLEHNNATFLKVSGVPNVEYEAYTISYNVPSRQTRYTPDFVLPNGIIIETKGRFLPDDRQKHLLIKEQYPDLDIRFVFTSSKEKLYKGSKTSYAEWCKKFNFKYADRLVPVMWLNEQASSEKLSALSKALIRKNNASKGDENIIHG